MIRVFARCLCTESRSFSARKYLGIRSNASGSCKRVERACRCSSDSLDRWPIPGDIGDLLKVLSDSSGQRAGIVCSSGLLRFSICLQSSLRLSSLLFHNEQFHVGAWTATIRVCDETLVHRSSRWRLRPTGGAVGLDCQYQYQYQCQYHHRR